MQMALSQCHESSKAEFVPLVAEEEATGEMTHCCWLGGGGALEKEHGCLRLRGVCGQQQQPNGASVPQPQELNCADNLNESGGGFPLSASGQGLSLAA